MGKTEKEKKRKKELQDMKRKKEMYYMKRKKEKKKENHSAWK